MSTTIRVDEKTRDQLAQRAAQHGRSLAEEVAAILEDLSWRELGESMRVPSSDPRLAAEYAAERDAWLEADLGDGLGGNAAAEYPEYQPESPGHRPR